ncbi:sensor histidine kinase [Actinophytocola sp.]|uniref:sensor histidine kinase n=1 Tax=Actinophytocola sp. TaxID=1872138 RepID=UPI00389A0D95
MSSNQERKGGVESWSLRRRLIFEQIVLLALVCVIIVLVTEVALRAFLINQLDDRLTEANTRARNFIEGPTQGGPPPGQGNGEPSIFTALGQGPGTLLAQVQNGQVAGAFRRTSAGDDEDLPSSEYTTLLSLPVNAAPTTRDLGDFGEFRLIARQGHNNDVFVTGLPLSDVNDVLLSAGLIMAGVALAGLLAAAGAGAFIVRRALQPLQRVAATASKVADLPLDRGEVELAERLPKRYTDPNTEVGQVGLAFNRMLGNVQDALLARHESETRVRQFVADASHELRTPLAAVRGYTELIRRRDDAVTPEVDHALSRVESESVRMTALVEDLLLLARLDSGRPLERGPVDLSRLVVDVVSDAQVAGQGHVWRLDLSPDPVVVPGDNARLHQVLANLLSNARTHTPPGTTVTVGLSTKGGYAVLSVTDNGPGIPRDLLPAVFERFARGDSSRSRAAGSTGLGLAIVAAVVQAHHGRVEVQSQPGRTRFTVRLPARLTRRIDQRDLS